MDKHPMQPIIQDEHGDIRFKVNKAVRMLYDKSCGEGPPWNGFGMNELMVELGNGNVSQDDMVQLAQLIGYSLHGFHELNYVPDLANYWMMNYCYIVDARPIPLISYESYLGGFAAGQAAARERAVIAVDTTCPTCKRYMKCGMCDNAPCVCELLCEEKA